MLRLVRAVGIVVVLLASSPGGAAEASASGAGATLRLEDAIQLTLTRNETARIADLNVVVADAAVEKARAAFLPVLTATGEGQLVAAGKPPLDTLLGNITLVQPLINAPAFPLYAQAKHLLDAQKASTVDQKRLLAFSAATAFFAVLAAQAVSDAAARQLENAKSNLADTKARADAQLTSSNDVTRANIDVAGAARELEVDRGAVDSAMVQLGFVVNARVSTLVAPSQTFAACARAPAPAESLVRFALDHRPDVVASRYAAVAAHDFAREPLLRLVPTLSVQGQVTGTSNTSTIGQWNNEQVMAILGWTLYDAGVRYSDLHGRDALAEISDLTLAQLRRSVDAQVREASALLVAAQAAFRVAEDAVKAARQGVEETAILYRQGLAKAIELVDANDTRFTAEVNDASAQYAAAQAYLNLRQALGLDPLGADLP